MALDEPKDSDKVFTNGGAQYIIDHDLLKQTGNITIDFVMEGWQKGFTVHAENPVSGSCSIGGGCSTEGSCSC